MPTSGLDLPSHFNLGIALLERVCLVLSLGSFAFDVGVIAAGSDGVNNNMSNTFMKLKGSFLYLPPSFLHAETSSAAQAS